MTSTWFRRFTTAAGDGPRLVCFPHAGGSATAFKDLAHTLPANFDVVSVQYPGRQDRYGETPFTALTPLIEAVAAELTRELAADPGRPYALFGHSMGALVAFETALLLARGELPGPQRLFLSGRGGPETDSAPYHLFGDAEVLDDVRRLGGTDQAMLDDPDLLELVLPALRADYRALGTYSWHGGEPLRGGLDGFLIPSARGRGLMPRAARELAQSLLDAGWSEVTVDPYEWNDRAVRGWARAGFVEVSRGHPPDDDHTAPWVLMRFVGV